MKHLGDICKINGAEVTPVSVIIGGSPCQDLSVAGKRAGLAGERSGLFMEQIRIIKEMREKEKQSGKTNDSIRPRYMVWENVPGAFSSNKGEDFRAVLEETARIAKEDAVIPGLDGGEKWRPAGCIMGDGWSIAWRVHDAQFWGVPQRRKRIALVADFGGTTAPEILFERKGVSGDITESGEPGERVTKDAERGIRETSASGFPLGFRAENTKTYDEKATTVCNGTRPGFTCGVIQGFDAYNQATNACGGTNTSGAKVVYKKQGHPQNAEQGQGWEETGVNDTLNAFDSGETRTPTLIVDQGGGKSGCHVAEDVSPTLTTTHGGEPVVLENHPADSRVKISEDGVCQTLSGRMGTGGGNVPMVMSLNSKQQPLDKGEEIASSLGVCDYKEPQAVCIGNGQTNQSVGEKTGSINCMHDQQAVITYGLDRASFNQGQNAKYNFSVEEEKIGAQVARGPGAVFNSIVRRLTPLECERLQGFPDYWTDIGDWVDSKGKKHKDADSPRYKALGNSIALPFWEWMLKRMMQYLDEKTMASLFDGIGGFPLIWNRNGGKTLWASEIEEFPIAVTKRRFGDE